jgi:hypothetical protein
MEWEIFHKFNQARKHRDVFDHVRLCSYSVRSSQKSQICTVEKENLGLEECTFGYAHLLDILMMGPKKRTRYSTFTHLGNFLGTGRQLLPSELPTLRDVLRYGLLLRELSESEGTTLQLVWQRIFIQLLLRIGVEQMICSNLLS